MKHFFILLAILFSPEVFPQQEEKKSGGFVHLSSVDQAPYSENCIINTSLCTANAIEKFVARNVALAGTIPNTLSGKTEVFAKVIIDTLGQVSWASVKGLPIETGKVLAERLKQMPRFIPGEHEGKKANVIVDVKVPLYLWEEKNFSSEVYSSREVDVFPSWRRCKKADDARTCTIEGINGWMLKKVDHHKIKEAGVYSLVASFVLGQDGTVKRIAVHGGGDLLAQEFIGELQKLPQVGPAQIEGKTVAVSLGMNMTGRKF